MRHLVLYLAVLPALGCCTAALAAPEFRAGYGTWRYDLSGTVTDRNRTYDLREDLELQPSGRRTVQVEWDTGPGWWPDWSASFTQLGASGMHTETVTFDPLPLPPQTETITASADFDDYDLTLRYPFGLGPLDCAAGITIKKLRGDVLIDDSSNPPPSRQSYDETVPQLHARLRWPLGKWLALTAAGQGIKYDGNSASEWRATAELRLGPVLLEGGWQAKRYDLQLTGYALDAQLDGALARVGFAWR